MPDNRTRALAEFRRMLVWIALAAILMVAGALWYISLYEPLRLHMVIATVAGVFFSVLLGCGLFAAAFYSDKSGHDCDAADATSGERSPRPSAASAQMRGSPCLPGMAAACGAGRAGTSQARRESPPPAGGAAGEAGRARGPKGRACPGLDPGTSRHNFIPSEVEGGAVTASPAAIPAAADKDLPRGDV